MLSIINIVLLKIRNQLAKIFVRMISRRADATRNKSKRSSKPAYVVIRKCRVTHTQSTAVVHLLLRLPSNWHGGNVEF